MKKLMSLVVLSACAFFQAGVQAESSVLVTQLQQDWAKANYQLKNDEQESAYESLIELADTVVTENPDSAELWVWNGIIKSSYAGVKGGLGALSLVKESKNALEKAIELDASALDGSAYTSLGTLYFKVPGWPISFGDNDKAKELLEKALEINPEGIDSNYFYADYLLSQKELKESLKHFVKAQQAAPREDRPVADQGRQEEISLALQLLRDKLSD